MSLLTSKLKLGTRLGNGHFGEVYSCDDDVHGQVAVKVIRQKEDDSAAKWKLRKEELVKEGRRLSLASHANVVGVHQILYHEEDDTVWLVMDLCRNGSLQEKFEKGPMDLNSVRKAATEICLGLNVIHSRGMLHRDIKPANVLLDAHMAARISDFGLVTDDIVLGYASQAGYADHVAVEVFAEGRTSVKSDVWAFGMTIYRLLHGGEWYGRLPASPADVIPFGGFARSLPWLPHVPDGWRRFIRKTMHDDPNQRYQNATQLLAALSGLPVEPDWSCIVGPTEIRWHKGNDKRSFHVTWEQHSPRKHRWSAWSEPKGKGNRRSLGGSNALIGRSECVKQLDDFFAAQ